MPKLLEVRCCCQPKKLLGWLPVPDNTAEGMMISFPFTEDCRSGDRSQWPISILTLQVARIAEKAYDKGHLALKVEGVGLDVLRKVLGFKEYEYKEYRT